MTAVRLEKRLKDPAGSGVFRALNGKMIRAAARRGTIDLVRVSLSGVSDKSALLNEFARAIGFPSWFGGNWDAMEDCLGDLSWRPAKAHVLMLESFETLLERNPDDIATLLDVLAASAAVWAGEGRGFVAVLIDPGRRLALPELEPDPDK